MRPSAPYSMPKNCWFCSDQVQGFSGAVADTMSVNRRDWPHSSLSGLRAISSPVGLATYRSISLTRGVRLMENHV